MEAPNKIYVPLVDMGVEEGGIQPAAIWWKRDKSMEKQDCKGVVKYIRADLAELTWEDIKKIELLLFALECSAVRPYRGENLYKEVLHRFLESKKEVEL